MSEYTRPGYLDQFGHFHDEAPPPPAPKPAFDLESPDPRETGMAKARAGLAEGWTYERAAGAFLAELTRAAMSGDPRPIAKNFESRLVDLDSGQILEGQ